MELLSCDWISVVLSKADQEESPAHVKLLESCYSIKILKDHSDALMYFCMYDMSIRSDVDDDDCLIFSL